MSHIIFNYFCTVGLVKQMSKFQAQKMAAFQTFNVSEYFKTHFCVFVT